MAKAGCIGLSRLMFRKQVYVLGAVALFTSLFVACTPEVSGTTGPPRTPDAPVDAPETATGEESGSSSTGPTRQLGEAPSSEFDTAAFAAINPGPDSRLFDYEDEIRSDLEFLGEDRIPRDAIKPIYTPSFVSPEESPLQPEELVMGVEINGDARAYPVGMLRVREMVNDEVGGTPVLVTW